MLGWIKHYSPMIMVWALAAWLPLGLLGAVLDHVGPTVVGVAAFFAGQIGALAHRSGRRVCDRCALDYPKNGTALATKHTLALAYHHNRRLGVVWWVASAIAFLGVLAFSGTAYVVFAAAFCALQAWEWRVEYLHQRLHPWCPGCNRRDDGDVSMPEPDPSLTQERT